MNSSQPIIRPLAFLLTALSAFLSVSPPLLAKTAAVDAEPALGEEWVRVAEDENGKPQALEVAIVRYLPAKQAKQFLQANTPKGLPQTRQFIDLIGAVHVGDAQYYAQLNRRFRQYQALLYELVAPPGTRLERGRGTSNLHPVGAMQNSMKSLLEVEHQLEKIDYTRPNFVHADMSPEEFASSMESREESFMKMYTRMMEQAIALQSEQAAQGESTDLELFTALFSSDRPRMLKTAIAKQFQSMESVLSGMSGPEGSTLITERNKKALEVLRQELRKSKQKIGIFYGAGHLTDMHERLVKDFGYEPVGIVWVEAWDLRKKK